LIRRLPLPVDAGRCIAGSVLSCLLPGLEDAGAVLDAVKFVARSPGDGAARGSGC